MSSMSVRPSDTEAAIIFGLQASIGLSALFMFHANWNVSVRIRMAMNPFQSTGERSLG